jgi:D-amino-acid dehydrogenase
MDDAGQAVVVGAGIVGICCAIALRRRGRQVTLVDRLEPGAGCSFGNAGILAAHGVVPTALPGLLARVPRMLLDRESPLVIRWSALPRTLPWLLRFARAAHLEQVRRTADAMKALYGDCVALHGALAREAGVPELVRMTPGLYVHRDPARLDPVEGLAWKLRRERGAAIEVLDGAALHEAEPALAPAYRRGLRMGPMGFTTNPFRLAQAYARLCARLGGTLLQAEVRAIEARGSGVRVLTSGAALEADTLVVAAGAWTAALLRPLGVDLPLVAERGYHLTFADPGIALNHVVSELEWQVAVTSMEPGLRIAGTEEIGLADDPPSWRRAALLQRHAQRMFPAARLEHGSRWMGPRPGTPDSLPLIGPLPRHARVFVAAGHGHLGLTGAPRTARIVAALVAGEPPEVAAQPYAADRFER